MPESIIRLGFGNSVIESHIPDAFDLAVISKKIQEEGEKHSIESFGLFDVASPNFNTYYPDVTAEDLKPKNEDFINPVFRALSEVIVHKEWNPVDFSMNGVLKKSMSLLKGQTLYQNHEAVVGNEVGVIVDTNWDNPYKMGNVNVPAGINAKLKVDGKSNPKIARGIMMEPPAIHSTSVTVRFGWDKSHDLPDNEFFGKLGTYDKDGKLYRRIATQIKNYSELSFVTHGADPFAQKVNDNGQIVNPVYANTVYNSADKPEARKAQKFFWFDYKTDLIKNSENITIPTESNNNENHIDTMNRTFLIALALTYGLVEADLPAEDDALANLIQDTATNKATELQTALSERTTAQERVTQLEAELAEEKKKTTPDVTALTSFKDTFTNSQREKTKKLYLKVVGDKPLEAVSKLIENADYNTLVALSEQYEQEVEAKYPAKCTNCGKTGTISRASAQATKEEPKDTSLSDEDIVYKKKRENGIKFI